MKTILLSTVFFATSFTFAQITLDHTFPNNEFALVYANETQTFYFTHNYQPNSNTIKIYNSDYSLYKTITLELPTGYYTVLIPETENVPFVSKYIFNTDDKMEFLVAYRGSNGSKMQIINEDGVIIKDFDNIYYDYSTVLFTDKTINKNKLILETTTGISEVYLLPTSTLSSKEIQTNVKLSAFPIPTNNLLNIVNPDNGANNIEIYDMSGKLVRSQNFESSQDRIPLDVGNLSKGNYVYKIGNLSSKFIKN